MTTQDKHFTLPMLILLGVLSAIAPLSIDMYLPSFPTIQNELHAAAGTVEFTLASFFIGLTVGQLFYGPLSDRFGRKPPLYAGFVIYTVASIGAMSSQSIEALVLWRLLQGLGGCAGIILPMAIVRDRSGARESAKIFSMLLLVMGAAPILAPLAGGWVLLHFSWQAILGCLAFFSTACIVGIYLILPETHATEHEPPLQLSLVLKNYAGLFQSKAYLGYALGGGLAMAGMFAYISGSPYVIIQLYGVSPQDYGWYFGSNAFGLILSSQINAVLLKRFDASQILRQALRVPALASCVLLVANWVDASSLGLFAACFFCFVTSLGFIIPNATACALSTHGQQAGTAAALMSAMQFLAATLSGALVGILHNGSGTPLAMVMSLCGVSALVLHHVFTAHPHESIH